MNDVVDVGEADNGCRSYLNKKRRSNDEWLQKQEH